MQGRTLQMLLYPEPVTLAAFANTQGAITQITTKIYEGLIEYDEALSPVPCLAESWEVDHGLSSFRFNLRKGVRFHDGAPFTSADVRFTFMEVLKRVHPRGRWTFRDLEDVVVPDAHTAVLRFARPIPNLFAALSSFESPILPRHLADDGHLARYAESELPVGTGPFQFLEWRRGREVRLERNRRHWKGGACNIDAIDVVFVEDPAVRVAMLLEGHAHVGGMGTIPWRDGAKLEVGSGLFVRAAEATALAPILMLDFNTRRPPFDNVLVRRAVSEALPRQRIIDEIFNGYGKPMHGPMHSSWIKRGLVSPIAKQAFLADRIDRASLMLDDAGLTKGSHGHRFKFVLDIIPYGKEWSETGPMIAASLAEIGIEVELREGSFESWLSRIYGRYDFDATINYVYLNLDPALGIHRFYHSEAMVSGRPFTNAAGWSSPKTDGLMNAASVEIRGNARADLYGRLDEKLVAAAPAAWIAELLPLSYCSTSLQDVLLPPFDIYGSFAEARTRDVSDLGKGNPNGNQ
jgi:peptide/nickel transport system substrate-binding protein